jgi:hypothetical protein
MANQQKANWRFAVISDEIDIGEVLLVLFFDLPKKFNAPQCSQRSREIAPYMVSESQYIRTIGY